MFKFYSGNNWRWLPNRNYFRKLSTFNCIWAKRKGKTPTQPCVIESLEEDASARKSDDINKVTSLFSDYLGVTCSVTNAVRIGKKGTKPHLLKVSVSNLQEKISILWSKMKLRDKNLPEHITSILLLQILHHWSKKE